MDIVRETVIDLEGVARKCQVHIQTVYNWTRRKVRPLESAKLGGKVVTTLEALERFAQYRGLPPAKKERNHSHSRQHKLALERLKEVHGI